MSSFEGFETATIQHEKKPFTVISNESIERIYHTGALGIYVYLSCNPEISVIDQKKLQDHFNCTGEHIETCLDILVELGFIGLGQEEVS